jgi:hypothetical protein
MAKPKIRTEVFSRKDIQNILRAIKLSQDALSSNFHPIPAPNYQTGFTTALAAIATAFDVQLQDVDLQQHNVWQLTAPQQRLLQSHDDGF